MKKQMTLHGASLAVTFPMNFRGSGCSSAFNANWEISRRHATRERFQCCRPSASFCSFYADFQKNCKGCYMNKHKKAHVRETWHEQLTSLTLCLRSHQWLEQVRALLAFPSCKLKPSTSSSKFSWFSGPFFLTRERERAGARGMELIGAGPSFQ